MNVLSKRKKIRGKVRTVAAIKTVIVCGKTRVQLNISLILCCKRSIWHLTQR